jgi:hypothetical protein
VEFFHRGDGVFEKEKHPAALIGLTTGRPMIRLNDKLNRVQKIEAFAHELVHTLFIYKFGLRVMSLRSPCPSDSDEIFRFCMNMNKDWNYILGQIVNTAHHIILIDYLKEKCGIGSSLHLQLLQYHFCRLVKDDEKEKESLFARGFIAFEYERLIGKLEGVLNLDPQTEFFWKAYHSAQKHLEKFSFHSIPSPSYYTEHLLGILEDLGYPKEDFIFCS